MPAVPTSWQKQEAEKVDEDEGGEREEEQEEEVGEGVVPLIQFRDPHLAGWENHIGNYMEIIQYPGCEIF
jgi:hypothetical protein